MRRTGRASGRSPIPRHFMFQETLMSSAESHALNAQALAQFTGSETFYRHPLSGGCVFTEGVHYLAQAGSAFWLIDAILCPQLHVPALRDAEFQVWTLTVREDRSATLV